MGMRFRKSIKIAPGVKFNINKKSVGLTVGTKGAHYTINSKGKQTASVGLPGTGLSYSTSTGGSEKGSNSSSTMLNEKLQLSPKNKTVTLLLCIFFGAFGVHRFYAGKIGTGICWLLTVGVCCLGWWYDIYAIATGRFTDGNGCLIT